MNVRLVKPTINLKEQYMDFYLDWKMSGEKISPGVLRKSNPEHFKEMVQSLLEIEAVENTPEGNVSESVYWLVNEENCIVGAVTLRHRLTERMLNSEGHIGAGIRPSERRNGYATKILELALDKMREKGFKEALVTCNEGNTGSEKAILNNNGIRDVDFIEAHGNIVKRFWIPL